MDQLALPYRIALVALLVVVMAWFAVLRPKSDSGGGGGSTPTSTATAPGVTGLGKAIDKAKGAVTQSQTSAANAEAAAGQTTTQAAPSAKAPAATPAPKPAAKPRSTAPATSDLSGPVVAALAKGKVAVMLFSDGGADDAHVRTILGKLDLHGGHVAVFSAPMSQVGRYSAITRDVQVLQGPTVLVISPAHKARAIVGYTDLGEVQQLVDDVGRFSS